MWNLVPAADVPVGALENCDHIAFQHTSLIQPHVVFLNVDRESLRILNASLNTFEILGIAYEDLIDKPWSDAIVKGSATIPLRISNCPHSNQSHFLDTTLLSKANDPLLTRFHATDTRILIEIEKLEHPADLGVESLADFMVVLGDSLESMQCINSMSAAIDMLRMTLKMDHCLLYRFDPENNGEVIAESRSERCEQSYLGLRFPTRDVPLSARRMMEVASIRTAADQSVDCVPILPRFDPITGDDIDLTAVRARGSVRSCQDFYVNLGVKAKLVLPLKVNGVLWGMIVCHHHDPLRISPLLDSHLKTIARLFCLTIERITYACLRVAEAKGRDALRALSAYQSSLENAVECLQSQIENFKELIPCGGLVLRIAGHVITAGNVPQKQDLALLLDTLLDAADRKNMYTNCIPLRFPKLAHLFDLAAGAIVIPIATNQNDIAVWIRPERISEVSWAGNPNENVHMDQQGGSYLSPRNSFEVWKSKTKHTCEPWRVNEIALADSASMQLALVVLGWYATQASVAKSEFFACMSHELRTPMTAILGYAELLSDERNLDAAPQLSHEYVETIQRNGTHLLKIIDDVLDMAKIESGKLAVERIQVDIEVLAQEVLLLMKPRAEEKKVELKLKIKSKTPRTILSDPVRLRQILLNLIGNSIKFSDAGAVILSIGMDATASEQIAFDVIDHGIGMTPAQQARLFNAFTQAESSTTRRFGGSGLGLMISKNLAILLGGDISITSEHGKGSTFRVTIATGPIESNDFIDFGSESKSPRSNEARPSVGTAVKDVNLCGKRILLMEDGKDNQRLIEFLLRRAGAEVTLADDGKVGIEMLTVDGTLDGPLRHPVPFELILTDMQMPEIDGYTATRLLREKGCELPIIALTAFAMKADSLKCIDAGCNDYLSKPLNRESLIKTVSHWLDNSSSIQKHALNV